MGNSHLRTTLGTLSIAISAAWACEHPSGPQRDTLAEEGSSGGDEGVGGAAFTSSGATSDGHFETGGVAAVMGGRAGGSSGGGGGSEMVVHSGGAGAASGEAESGGTSGGGGADVNGAGGAGGAGGTPVRKCLDVFGRAQFYATAEGGLEWDSRYWSGPAHLVEFGTPDVADPLLLANARGTGEVMVHGDGTLTMTGSEPRLYLGTADNHPWKNVEVTVEYQRMKDDNTPWAGLVIGARSGPNGHGEDNCSATTYYARMRHDGSIDVAKELEHPTSEARATERIWNGHELSKGVFITLKYVVTNTANGAVRLQVFRSREEPDELGSWESLVDILDEGGWAPASDCAYPKDYIITEGGGVVLIRNTGLLEEGARYKNLTVREVDEGRGCE